MSTPPAVTLSPEIAGAFRISKTRSTSCPCNRRVRSGKANRMLAGLFCANIEQQLKRISVTQKAKRVTLYVSLFVMRRESKNPKLPTYHKFLNSVLRHLVTQDHVVRIDRLSGSGNRLIPFVF